MTLEKLNEHIRSNEAVMIYFSGQDCGVCEILKPKIKELLENKFPKVNQLYINAADNKETAANLGIFSVPTLIIYLDGKEFIRKSRNFSPIEIEKELQRPYDLFFN